MLGKKNWRYEVYSGYFNNLPQNIKGILFDKDGTLFEVSAFWNLVYQHAIDRWVHQDTQLAFAISETLNRPKALKAIGLTEHGLEENSIAAMGSVEEVWYALCGHFASQGEGHFPTLPIFEEWVLEGVKLNIGLVSYLIPDAKSLLFTLAERGYKLGLITTDSRANTLFMLKHFQMEAVFDFIGCGDDPILPKPHPIQGNLFFQKTALTERDVVMIGDSDYDASFAKSLGIPFVHISNCLS